MERPRGRDRLSHRPAQFSDMKALGPDVCRYDPEWDKTPEVIDEQLARTAITFLINDTPEAILALPRKWKNVPIAAAWSFIRRDHFEGNTRNTFALIKLAKRLIEGQAQKEQFRRAELLVDADDDQALEFARVLGFTEETGRMKEAGPRGEDLVQMVRFWEVV